MMYMDRKTPTEKSDVIMEIVFEEELRRRMMAGVDTMADAVKATLGPKGRNVAMHQKSNLHGADYADRAGKEAKVLITNDGATIAQSLILSDPVENMGAQLLKEAAMKANSSAGDGTTTAIVLAQRAMHEIYRGISAGGDPLAIRRGMNKAVKTVKKALLAQAQPIQTRQEIAAVATISCQDTLLGDMVGQALDKVGLEGVISVTDSQKTETTLEILEGIVFDRGFTAPYMATNTDTMTAELYDPYILFYDGKLDNAQDIIPALILAAEDGRPMLILSDGVEGEALGLIERNKTEGDLDVVCVVAPLYGDGRRWRMTDMALQTGGTFITKELCMNIRDVTRDMLGTAQKATITLNRTTIVGPGGDPLLVENRIKELRHYAQNTDYAFNAQRHRERLAAFVSGIASISVGGKTETELWERKMRVEDAVQAARAAYEQGIVPGGGLALWNTLPALRALLPQAERDEGIGIQAVIQAVQAPLRQIADNAGVDGSAVIARLSLAQSGIGYDAKEDRYVDMLQAGIIDPVKVTCAAFESAMSVAATIMTAEAGLTGNHSQEVAK